MKTFALALGGGGVKGLAHIALLKRLDQLGAKPTRIAGTSMGAIVGALYALGLSGEEIEARVTPYLIAPTEGLRELYRRRHHLISWLKVFSLDRRRGGFLTAEGLFDTLFEEIVHHRFEDLKVPLKVVATDFHSGEEVVLERGPLLPAVQASMAVPGVFAPVSLDSRLLVDGGLVNNVPTDLVAGAGEVLIASDVICLSRNPEPTAMEVLSGSLSVMLKALTQFKYQLAPPALVFTPDTDNIDAFDFHKIGTVLEAGEAAAEALMPALETLLRD